MPLFVPHPSHYHNIKTSERERLIISSRLFEAHINRSEDKINSAQYEAKTALDLNLRFLLA